MDLRIFNNLPESPQTWEPTNRPTRQNNNKRKRQNKNWIKPYKQYLRHSNGFLYFSLAVVAHSLFVVGQMAQGYILAVDLQNPDKLLDSLFRAPMSFYDSTPLGRILSRVSSDLSIVDIEVAFKTTLGVGQTINAYSGFLILAVLAWHVLLVIVPIIYLCLLLQNYYYASAKELMRIAGTTKSTVASYLAESISGVMTIRAFGQENRFFQKHLDLVDANARPDFHNFSANEWLIQRLELLCTIVLCSSALAMTLLSFPASSSGIIGMAMSYGPSLNVFLVSSVQLQCL
ncbi:PREDICTED: ABC transporter C family member 10-like [Tarenaya hassleriana]|uniref:ABC transporter C family member 10-like n=1 Tax=Tarenaya hassleriana TaxID=28532 RepID=UPI0008FD3119|nr:PREDICTED: ABC transporter C family member 10-like [Tarenaya hassleriana]